MARKANLRKKIKNRIKRLLSRRESEAHRKKVEEGMNRAKEERGQGL